MKAHKSKNLQISTADGSQHEIVEILDVPIVFDNQFHVLPMFVMPNLLQNMILGKDFFDMFGITLKFNSEAITKKSSIETITLKEPAIISKENLNEQQKLELDTLIEDMKNTIGNGLGRTHLITHTIDTGVSKPLYRKQYNFSPVIKKQIEKELDDMLNKDVVEPSYSSWCSPVLIVKKPNGENRLCLDSRQINKVTKRDTYPLPRVVSTLDNLRNAKYLSTIDLKSAFWQIPLDDTSKEKTAFAVPGRGLYQFKVMPFGLVNASQTQQRLMDKLFHSVEDNVWAYLDDIIVCSSSFDRHIKLLRQVIKILKDANITVNIDKCRFARASLRYLGYIVDKDGLRTDPDKVTAILNFPRPKNLTELKRFIGLASWYRRFVNKFSEIAAPLHDLTKGKRPFRWTQEADSAFTKLKTMLTDTPVMACPDYSKPFIIQCDASNIGVGAVLCQSTGNAEQAVAYLSRKLSDREKKFSTSERELLSVVYAIEKFRPYIEGSHFKVITDHSALQWLHNMKDPHGRLARWSLKLQQFDFEIVHRPGKCNVVPDTLSRAAHANAEINIIEVTEKDKDQWYINKIRQVTSKPSITNWLVKDNVLYKRVQLKQYPTKDKVWKLFVPESLRTEVLKECHNNVIAGHFGIRKTLLRIKQHYFWYNMLGDTKKYIGNCETCAKFKVSQSLPAGLMGQHREVTRPWQIISLDLMGPFPKSKRCNTMLLVVTCWFSKFVLLFPLRTGKADKICSIMNDQFLLYGAPEYIICDNGKQFESHLFKDLASKYDIKLWYTPYYHPQSNPTERVNRVVGTMIAAYTKSKKHNEWDINLQEIGHAIRTAVHESTGYTPAYLFFGRETTISSLKLDKLILDPNKPLDHNIGTFLLQLEKRNDIYKKVQNKMRESHANNTRSYNKKRSFVEFKLGDIVWKKTKYLSNANNKFMAKLAPKYEKAIIVDRISTNVYRLHNVFGKDVGIWHVKDLKKR